MSTEGAFSNAAPTTIRLADLEKVIREARALPKLKWALVAPDGRVWMEENPAVLLRVLAGMVPLDSLFKRVDEEFQASFHDPEPML